MLTIQLTRKQNVKQEASRGHHLLLDCQSPEIFMTLPNIPPAGTKHSNQKPDPTVASLVCHSG